MKKLAKSIFLLMMGAVLALSIAACTGPTPAAPTVEKIQIATAGKTEFTVGDDFSTGSLAVEEVKSDATKRTLTADEITVDSSAYDKTKAGTYNIVIKLKADETKTVAYDVNVNLVPLTNYLESLQSAIEDLEEAEIPSVTYKSDYGIDKEEITLTKQSEKLLYKSIDESIYGIEKQTVTYVDGTVYVKVEAFGKEQLQKKSGTWDELLSELGYGNSQLNPAIMAIQFTALIEQNDITSEDITYSIKDHMHVLETEVDLGRLTSFALKIDGDGKLSSVEWYDDNSYAAIIYDYSTGTAITAPAGTYTEVAADTEIDDMVDHNLEPDAYANSAAAYNAILASIDNTAAIDNIAITYTLNGYSADLGADVEQSLMLSKSNGNVNLVSEITLRVLGSRVMDIYQEVTFINGTLYVYNYLYVEGLGEVVDAGEYITGVTEAEFSSSFASYYETFGGMLDFSLLKETFQQAADLQYEDDVTYGEHTITAQDEDGTVTVIITDTKYLKEIIIAADDGSNMSYHYNYWNSVTTPREEFLEYSTDVTGQKTVAQLFASLTE